MPINDENSKVIQAVVTMEEYERIRAAVKAAKKSGRKMTVSKYVAYKLRECWRAEDLFMPKNGESRRS